MWKIMIFTTKKGKRIEYSIEVDVAVGTSRVVGWLVYSIAAAVNDNFHALSFCFHSNWFASLFYVHGFCHVNAGRVGSVAGGKWNWIWYFEENDRQNYGKISIVVTAFGPDFDIWTPKQFCGIRYWILHIASNMQVIPFQSDKTHKNIDSIFGIW